VGRITSAYFAYKPQQEVHVSLIVFHLRDGMERGKRNLYEGCIIDRSGTPVLTHIDKDFVVSPSRNVMCSHISFPANMYHVSSCLLNPRAQHHNGHRHQRMSLGTTATALPDK
jgi:hypothetical protein